jgi:hypothetical protein
MIHQVNMDDEIVLDVLLPGAELHVSNAKNRKVKKVFNDQHWSHSSRKRAAGFYVNGKLVQLLDFVVYREIYFQVEGDSKLRFITFD